MVKKEKNMSKSKIEQITERGKKKLNAWYKTHSPKENEDDKASGLKKVIVEYASRKNVAIEKD